MRRMFVTCLKVKAKRHHAFGTHFMYKEKKARG